MCPGFKLTCYDVSRLQKGDSHAYLLWGRYGTSWRLVVELILCDLVLDFLYFSQSDDQFRSFLWSASSVEQNTARWMIDSRTHEILPDVTSEAECYTTGSSCVWETLRQAALGSWGVWRASRAKYLPDQSAVGFEGSLLLIIPLTSVHVTIRTPFLVCSIHVFSKHSKQCLPQRQVRGHLPILFWWEGRAGVSKPRRKVEQHDRLPFTSTFHP